MAIALGSTIGSYRVVKKLGSGAMGTVFLAEHPMIGKRVALKIIHSDLADNPEMVSRFFTEARAVNQIGHANIIDVIDFGQTPNGENFIVMELLEGITLGERLKLEGTITLPSTLHMSVQIADGLLASHQRGIIHRDLKPDNIFLIDRDGDAEFVKILDFGLAKLTQGGGGALNHQTKAGSVLGTPHYMAPEQCEGKPVDHRVDIYALGCIMYQMLTGRVPFPGEGFGEVLIRHLREPPQPPGQLNPEVTPAVEKIILHALAKKREFRFATMQEFGDALRDPEAFARALDGEGSLDMPATPAPRPATAANKPSDPFDQRTTLDTPPPSLFSPKAQSPAAPTMEGRAPAADAFALADDELTRPPVRRAGSGALIYVVVALLIVGAGVGVGLYLLVPRQVALLVNSDPIGAEVLQGGRSLGKTPLVLHVPSGRAVGQLVLRKEGFEEATREVTATDKPVEVQLAALPEPPPAHETAKPAPTPEPPSPSPSPKPAHETKSETHATPHAPPESHARPHESPAPSHRPSPAAKPHGSKSLPKLPKKFDDDVMVPTF